LVREGAPSTTCSAALGKIVDAGLRRHDDVRVVVAPVDALTSPQVLGPARWHNHRWRLAAGRRKLRKVELRACGAITESTAVGPQGSCHARRTPSHPRRPLLGAAKFRRAKKCEVSRDAAHFAAGMTFACRVGPRHQRRESVPGIVCHPGQLGLGFREMCRTMRHSKDIGRDLNVTPLEVSDAKPRDPARRFSTDVRRGVSRKSAGKLRRLSRIVHVAPRRRP
jgi:hypothetical protein